MCEKSRAKTLVALRAASGHLDAAAKMVVQLRRAHDAQLVSVATDRATAFERLKAMG